MTAADAYTSGDEGMSLPTVPSGPAQGAAQPATPSARFRTAANRMVRGARRGKRVAALLECIADTDGVYVQITAGTAARELLLAALAEVESGLAALKELRDEGFAGYSTGELKAGGAVNVPLRGEEIVSALRDLKARGGRVSVT